MNLLSKYDFETLPPELHYNILLQCSRRELNQVALVSRRFHALVRENKFFDSQYFITCSNIYLDKKIKLVYLLDASVFDEAEAIAVYLHHSSIKIFQIRDAREGAFVSRKLIQTECEIGERNALKFRTEEVPFSELADVADLESARFATRNAIGGFALRSICENDYKSNTDTILKLTRAESNFDVAKFLKVEDLKYSYESVYDCLRSAYKHNNLNHVLTVSRGGETIKELYFKGPIQGIEVIGSFLFVLVSGQIQIFETKGFRQVSDITAPFAYFAMQSNEEKSTIYALHSRGLEVYDFSQYQNPIEPAHSKFTIVLHLVKHASKTIFGTFIKTVSNPRKVIAESSFKHLVIAQISLVLLVVSSSCLQEVVLRVTCLFIFAVLFKSYQDFRLPALEHTAR